MTERFLRLSTVCQWLDLRRIGDSVGFGLCFGISSRMEFSEYILWEFRRFE